jgi:hypothetical protein
MMSIQTPTGDPWCPIHGWAFCNCMQTYGLSRWYRWDFSFPWKLVDEQAEQRRKHLLEAAALVCSHCNEGEAVATDANGVWGHAWESPHGPSFSRCAAAEIHAALSPPSTEPAK